MATIGTPSVHTKGSGTIPLTADEVTAIAAGLSAENMRVDVDFGVVNLSDTGGSLRGTQTAHRGIIGAACGLDADHIRIETLASPDNGASGPVRLRYIRKTAADAAKQAARRNKTATAPDAVAPVAPVTP